MSTLFKALFVFVAVLGVIALGLFWPTEDNVQDDAFEMVEHTLSYDDFRESSPRLILEETIPLHTIYSTKADISAGRFQYRENYSAWRFTTPIDWSKPHEEADVRRVIQRIALADPFLRSYAETGDANDFKQAVFFLLDWQAFYQDGNKITPHSWDMDSAQARGARLAYVLSEINRDRDLLSHDGAINLMRLADFHVQRVVNPVYGAQQDIILDTPEFRALCGVVELPACSTEN